MATAITIGIPVYQGVDLLDVTGPHEIFGWMDNPPELSVEIQLIAASLGDIKSRDGFVFKPTHTFATATTKLDALWVPGGEVPALQREMKHGSPYLDFLKQQADARFICSVCEGAMLLAASGLLDGFLATTHWAFVPCFSKFPKVNVAQGFPRFVLSGNRLTGGGISSGLDEAFKLVELLTDYETAQGIQQTTQYYPCPPVASELKPATSCPLGP